MSSTAHLPSKLLIVALCCAAPIAVFAAIWIMLTGKSDDEAVSRLALGFGILFVTTLVAHRAFESCTTRLDEAGVEQTKLMKDKAFFVKCRLPWNEIVKTSVQGHTYILQGAAFEVPVRLMVFSNPATVVAFIDQHLPKSTVTDSTRSP